MIFHLFTFHLEYHDLVTLGQTHSISTHKRFYDFSDVTRKEKLKKARTMNAAFQRITQNQPENIIHSNSADRETFLDAIRNSTYRVQPGVVPSADTLNAMSELDFGSAREDLHQEKKRYDWIDEEINFLIDYISTIECDTSKNRYAACLHYLKTEADAEIRKYFHPHHVANSDRLKNGFNVAIKRIKK